MLKRDQKEIKLNNEMRNYQQMKKASIGTKGSRLYFCHSDLQKALQ